MENNKGIQSIISATLLTVFISVVLVYAFQKYVEDIVLKNSANPAIFENVASEIRSLKNEIEIIDRRLAFEIEYRKELVELNKLYIEKFETDDIAKQE